MECNIYTIYSITCIDEKVKGIYVGSTKDFSKRQISHKCKCVLKRNLKLYKCMNENKGWLNWEFTCLQIHKCSKSDVRKLERFWYDKLDADLNMIKPHLTKEEKKLYYLNNKEAIIENNKLYYDKNRDKRLEKFKLYEIANKEIIASRKRQFYIENKEIIASKKTEKIYCELCDY